MAQNNYIGQIVKFGGNFCPRGTYVADGHLMAIAQDTALFALYGTTFGGNGQTTFAMPDYRGRSSLHTGTGPGLSTRVLGEVGGTEENTMTIANMPRHEHAALVRTTSLPADSTRAFRNVFGTTPTNKYISGTAPYAATMNRDTVIIRNTGGGQPYSHLPPTLAISYCVVSEGLFPSRN